MREIKFRGKRVDNGVWVHGDLVRITDGDGESSGVFVSESFDEIKRRLRTSVFRRNKQNLQGVKK